MSGKSFGLWHVRAAMIVGLYFHLNRNNQMKPKLKSLIERHFDLDELKDICFDLDIKYDDIPAKTRGEMARELIEYCHRRGRLIELLQLLTQKRPNASWPHIRDLEAQPNRISQESFRAGKNKYKPLTIGNKILKTNLLFISLFILALIIIAVSIEAVFASLNSSHAEVDKESSTSLVAKIPTPVVIINPTVNINSRTEEEPVRTLNSAELVKHLNLIGEIEMASIELEKAITYESGFYVNEINGIAGESIIFIAFGEVLAFVDFSEMSIENVQIDDQTVLLHLPEAQINETSILNNELSYIADRDSNFVQLDPQLETFLRREAEQIFIQEAIDAGLLERANYEAEVFVRDLLENIGYQNHNIIFMVANPPTPSAP